MDALDRGRWIRFGGVLCFEYRCRESNEIRRIPIVPNSAPGFMSRTPDRRYDIVQADIEAALAAGGE